MGGFPLGDLYHWFPDEYEHWKTQENAEHARISHWLNTGRDSIFTAIARHSDCDTPIRFELSQNYPNPFNSSTRIQYSIPYDGYISLKVFNLLGKEIATLFEGDQTAGIHTAAFTCKEFTSGIYFYQLRVRNFVETKKLTLLK